jgi:hypothetical protein
VPTHTVGDREQTQLGVQKQKILIRSARPALGSAGVEKCHERVPGCKGSMVANCFGLKVL